MRATTFPGRRRHKASHKTLTTNLLKRENHIIMMGSISVNQNLHNPMKNNGTTTAAASKHLLDEMHALVAEAEKMMESNSDRGDDVVGALRARFDSAQERLSEIYTDTRKKVVDTAKSTDKAIRTNPYQSLAIAAGVGVLLGLYMGRRNK
jgi:ElaB/YqjD/DUF883 family membrane-anchored ribosome-binding protein